MEHSPQTIRGYTDIFYSVDQLLYRIIENNCRASAWHRLNTLTSASSPLQQQSAGGYLPSCILTQHFSSYEMLLPDDSFMSVWSGTLPATWRGKCVSYTPFSCTPPKSYTHVLCRLHISTPGRLLYTWNSSPTFCARCLSPWLGPPVLLFPGTSSPHNLYQWFLPCTPDFIVQPPPFITLLYRPLHYWPTIWTESYNISCMATC